MRIERTNNRLQVHLIIRGLLNTVRTRALKAALFNACGTLFDVHRVGLLAEPGLKSHDRPPVRPHGA